MKQPKFELVEKSRANKLYLVLNFEGGDADTDHPEELLLDIPYSEIGERWKELEPTVAQYKQLQQALSSHRTTHKEVLDEYGEEVGNLYDNAPNDPQADYQFKCSLGSMHLIGYDESGNQYKSYL